MDSDKVMDSALVDEATEVLKAAVNDGDKLDNLQDLATLFRRHSTKRLRKRLSRCSSTDINSWFNTILRTPSLQKVASLPQSILQDDGWFQDCQIVDLTAEGPQIDNQLALAGSAGGQDQQLLPLPSDDDVPLDNNNLTLLFPKSEEDGKAARWTYSDIMAQLFVNINSPCPFQISFSKPIAARTVLRLYVKYSKPEHVHKAVERCPMHIQAVEGVPAVALEHTRHVMSCDNPTATFMTDPHTGTHAIQIEVDAGATSLHTAIRLHCFSSCSGGINRRPISIVAALQCGRQLMSRISVPIRVCACPSRDKKHAETAASKANLITQNAGSTARMPAALTRTHTVTATCKRNLDDLEDDDKEYEIKVRGSENFAMIKKIADALERNRKERDQAKRVRLTTSPSQSELDKIFDLDSFLDVWKLESARTLLVTAGYDDLELLEHVDDQELTTIGVANDGTRQRFLHAVNLLKKCPKVRKHNCFGPPAGRQIVTRVIVQKREPAAASSTERQNSDPDAAHT